MLGEKKFRLANPQFDPENPKARCFYVGQTGRTPEERFEQHKRGYKANRYVKRYGLWLRPRLAARYNRREPPMSYEESLAAEEELAERLRARGHAVWQH